VRTRHQQPNTKLTLAPSPRSPSLGPVHAGSFFMPMQRPCDRCCYWLTASDQPPLLAQQWSSLVANTMNGMCSCGIAKFGFVHSVKVLLRVGEQILGKWNNLTWFLSKKSRITQ